MQGGGVVPGVGLSEAPRGDGVEPPGDGSEQPQLQMQVDCAIALNRSAEVESGNAMDMDDGSARAPSQPEGVMQSPRMLTDTIIRVHKQLKRKRASNSPALAAADGDALAAGCRQELVGLFEYYKEVSGHRMQLDSSNLTMNGLIGCLLEESNLGLSKLVEETYEKLKGSDGVSVASVRSSVLLIGQRMMYGKSSLDADVLEDESELSLWCWEVRDLKLMPVKMRAFFSARRTARKKIHERITAINSTLSVLGSPEVEAQVNELRKVSIQLNKALNLEGIKSMVERVTQKNIIQRGAKDVVSTPKQPFQDRKDDQNAGRIEIVNSSELQYGNSPTNEKAIQKMQKQLEREIKRQEKEEHQMMKQQKKAQEEALREQKKCEKEEAEAKKRQKRQEEEALKDRKRHEKEEAEMRKQQKRQQEEAEKEQKRLEKEAAQLKKQLVIQKQASLMERFFKSKDSGKLEKSVENDTDALSTNPFITSKEIVSAATSIIDSSFSQKETWTLEDIQRLQIIGWQKLSNYNRSSRWGIRHKPKKEAFKELKLQKTSEDMLDEILFTREDTCHNSSHETDPDELENNVMPVGGMPCHATNKPNSLPTRLMKRKLLQFDKSNRPAYYGTWRKKSAVVGPKCPLRMDPDLDYEIDSDDEWEEEDPGESLSDCEKDNDDAVEEDTQIIDDESEDSFVVPDGYLSDNEGIQIESLLDDNEEDVSSMPPSQCPEVEEFRTLLRQQKVLNTLTEQALRKGQPLVISNITHEKDELLAAGDLKGMAKLEQLCLQVLSMCSCPGGTIVDVEVVDSSSANAEETNQSTAKSSPAVASAIPDTDLPEIVRVIQSSRDGITKLVELLHQTFPSVSKIQLNRKVRSISDFLNNRWQVKQEVLDKLGLNSSPGTTIRSPSTVNHQNKTEGIAKYFSKRCLPPEEAVNAVASSPELHLKSKTDEDGNGAPQVDLFSSSQ